MGIWPCLFKIKFREKGLDIEFLKISIDFKVKKYEKNIQNINSQTNWKLYQHPRLRDLNEIEKLKQITKDLISKDDNDKVINKINSAIERIDNRLKEIDSQN